ncbi:hypothetical protein [Pectinatus sottacetonis]|uniref:hypothetical protein n=1 Tax=Pectinatus sottacetonis TaxID=1002795 RepID=UPI0018C6387E|nr:hypothetical protein [Pectinatus sottacetonis]
MFNMSKKRWGVLAVGTMLTVGAAFPALTEAASPDNLPGIQQNMPPQGIHHKKHHGPRDGMGAFFPEYEQQLGLSKSDFDRYAKKGYRHGAIMNAALIAKTSGKSLDKIMSYKTADNSWKDVMEKVGITFDQLRQVHKDLASNAIAKKTGIDKASIAGLFDQKYHDRDIMMAAELSKLSSKPIGEIIGMKKINNSWRDVAQQLGVSDSAVRNDMMPPMHHHQNRNN